MSLIIINTKSLYDNFMKCDENGIDRFVENQLAIEKMQLSSEKVKFIKNYLSLIMETSIVSETTKLYIRWQSAGPIKPSFEDIIRDREKKGIKPALNINTCLSKVTYDTKKLLQFFPNDMIVKLRNVNTHNITSYQNSLYKAIAKYRKESEISSKLAIQIPMTDLNESLTNEEFEDFLRRIQPYSVKFIEQMMSEMPEKYIQYYNYLIYVKNKDIFNMERLKKLEKVLDGEQIIQAAENKSEVQAEAKEPKEQFIPDFSDNDEDTINLGKEQSESTPTIPQTRMSKEKGYKVGNDGLGKISTKGWVIK